MKQSSNLYSFQELKSCSVPYLDNKQLLISHPILPGQKYALLRIPCEGRGGGINVKSLKWRCLYKRVKPSNMSLYTNKNINPKIGLLLPDLLPSLFLFLLQIFKMPLKKVQEHLGEILGSVPNHHNKASHTNFLVSKSI